MTKNGKPTLFDPDTGRPIYIGDGIIPQVERFASKYAYNKLTVEAFTTAIAMMNEKSENQLVTNMYLFAMRKLGKTYKLVYQNGLQDSKLAELICGLRKLTAMLTLVLHSNLMKSVVTQFHSRLTITFSREWGSDKGFMLMLDLTADKVSGEPAIQMFTLKGGDFISNKYPGVGGLDGLSSGVVSSPVAASKLINWGYSGVGVFSPYRSFIMKEV